MRLNNKANSINLYTIIAVYFLILVGGIVRSTGAGMGCPDWPKCFGAYIPPTDDSQLPEQYQQAYVDARVRKNERLARIFFLLGFNDLANTVLTDPGIGEETFFDVQKAWVEYVNRLVGVAIGFLVVLNMWFTLRFWKSNRVVSVLGICSFVLVLFQGWVGSLVVSTNLLPGFISFHMLLALLLVGLLLLQRFKMNRLAVAKIQGKSWLMLLLILFTLQIVFGIQVREQIDEFNVLMNLPRIEWVENLGIWFYIHRSYSILLCGLIGYLYYVNRKRGTLNGQLNLLVFIVFVEIILGVVMAYFGVPSFAQPVHLLLGTMGFGVIFYLFLYASLKVKNS